MNQAINNDIKNNADNLKKSIQNEVNNISQTSMEMGRNISNTAKDAALKTEQLSRKTWSQAEGIANDARIRTTNKANELQEQAKNKASEIQEQAVTKGKEIQQQAIDTAKDVKENVEVAVLGKKEEGWFKNPLQFFKMPTLANITNKLSPKNLFCSSSTSSLPSINNTIDQFGGGGNGKKAIIDLLQYNLVKREKILNILFEDIMIIVSTGKKVPKKKEKKVLQLIQEVELIKTKIKRINQMVPLVKKNKLGRTIGRTIGRTKGKTKRRKTARKSRKKTRKRRKSRKLRKRKKKTKRRKK